MYDWKERKDRWHHMADLSQGRHSHSCFGFNDKIFVVGGVLAGGWLSGSDSAEVFDFDSAAASESEGGSGPLAVADRRRWQLRHWEAMPALPRASAGGFAFVWAGQPAFAGGGAMDDDHETSITRYLGSLNLTGVNSLLDMSPIVIVGHG